MARDLNKESQKIRNGNRYIFDEGESGVFGRDVDRLFVEYTNLRKSIYNRQKHKFSDQATREELESYIDEQFVRLVKEYDINNPVDFPGYIKTKLNLRVSQVFIKGRYRDKSRESLMKDEWGVKNLIEYDEVDSYQKERTDNLLNMILNELNLNEMEEFILLTWLEETQPQSKVVTQVTKAFGVKRKEAEETIEELKEYLAPRLETYIRRNKEEEKD